MTVEKLTFEGLAPTNGVQSPMVDGYGGLHWDAVGAVDRGSIHHNISGPSGYDILAGRGMAYTWEQFDTYSTHSTISGEGTFTLKSGMFSIIAENSIEVTFTAIKNGHVHGTQTALLGEAGGDVVFDSDFRHIDAVQITTPEFSYTSVGMENLKFALDYVPSGALITPHLDDGIHHPVEVHHGAFDSFHGMLA